MFKSYTVGTGCDQFSNKVSNGRSIGDLTIINTHLQSEELNFCCSKINNTIEKSK